MRDLVHLSYINIHVLSVPLKHRLPYYYRSLLQLTSVILTSYATVSCATLNYTTPTPDPGENIRRQTPSPGHFFIDQRDRIFVAFRCNFPVTHRVLASQDISLSSKSEKVRKKVLP